MHAQAIQRLGDLQYVDRRLHHSKQLSRVWIWSAGIGSRGGRHESCNVGTVPPKGGKAPSCFFSAAVSVQCRSCTLSLVSLCIFLKTFQKALFGKSAIPAKHIFTKLGGVIAFHADASGILWRANLQAALIDTSAQEQSSHQGECTILSLNFKLGYSLMSVIYNNKTYCRRQQSGG